MCVCVCVIIIVFITTTATIIITAITYTQDFSVLILMVKLKHQLLERMHECMCCYSAKRRHPPQWQVNMCMYTVANFFGNFL